MTSTTLLYAFSAGMVAAINPCGFALLPAYLSYYLGLESAAIDDAAERSRPIPRALAVAGAMTLGFVVVFGIIGAAWSTVSNAIGGNLPWVVVGLGVVMIGFGIAMVRGFVPMVKLPKLAASSGSQSAASAFVFGLSYGVASLSCAIAPFIAAVTTTFRRHSFVDGLVTLVMYALGMGAIICVLTLAVTFARHGIINRMRSLVPHMSRFSGALLVLSGIVAVYYGWYEASILRNGAPDSAFGRTVTGWRTALQRWISDTGEERIGLAVVLVILGAVAVSMALRRPAVPPAAEVSSPNASEAPRSESGPTARSADR
ncbi:MAG: cytochrome c biogenesis protein CcdA [Actinobacteria bacterium]|nr:cytochrome c biogenesis protein CcdA [Actinomycetota bacterium]